MKTQLDWSAYAHYGEGDAYADIPAQGGDFARAVAVCIGNRQCQRNERGVMCPSFRVTGEALHSTRERIVALKAVLNGAHVDFTDPRLWAALELCEACKGCKRECPNGVDMAALRIEALAQRHVLRGTPWRTRLFARLPRLLHRVPVLRQGLVLRNRLGVLRALGERWPGIAAQRDLPVPVPVPDPVPVPLPVPEPESVPVPASVLVLSPPPPQPHRVATPREPSALNARRRLVAVGGVGEAAAEGAGAVAAVGTSVCRGCMDFSFRWVCTALCLPIEEKSGSASGRCLLKCVYFKFNSCQRIFH